MIVQRLSRRRQAPADAPHTKAVPHAGGWFYQDAGSSILVWRNDRLPDGVVVVEAPRQAEPPREKPVPSLESQVKGMFQSGWKPSASTL